MPSEDEQLKPRSIYIKSSISAENISSADDPIMATSDTLEVLLLKQEQLFTLVRRTGLILENRSLLTYAKASSRLDYLHQQWAKCEELNLRLLLLVDVETRQQIPYFAEDQYVTLETIYLDFVGELKEFMFNPSTTTSAPAATSSPSHHQSISSPSVHVEPRRHTQVPRINLPRFSGAYADWPTFHDYFESLFIKDNAFDDLQRLHYLKSCLDGEAAKAISNISITADNFSIAWKTLNDRYANKRRLFNIHFTNLYSLKPVHRENSPYELRKLLDNALQSIDAMKALEHPIQDEVSVYIIVQRVDDDTRKAWELKFSDSSVFPTFTELKDFLDSRIRGLEAAASQQSKPSDVTRTLRSSNVQTHHLSASSSRCPICADNHSIYKCQAFLSKPISQRLELVQRQKLCVNCMTSLHRDKACNSKHSCFKCGKRHHTLLHLVQEPADVRQEGFRPQAPSTSQTGTSKSSPIDCTLVQSHFLSNIQPCNVVLATAWVLVSSCSQRLVKVRALLDQGSTHTFVSTELIKALNTKTYSITAVVSGIGAGQTDKIERSVPISIAPTHGQGPAFSTEALILDNLTSYEPQFRFPFAQWEHLRGLPLADERLTDNTPIHAIIGADLYPYVLRDGIRRGKFGEPVAQSTVFGWIISGHTASAKPSSSPTATIYSHHGQARSELDHALRQFWEIEEVTSYKPPSEEDVQCEEHFRSTHSRATDGRYVVRIPFKGNRTIDIGATRARAEHCLFSLEKRLAKRPDELLQYSLFLNEYESLGHMQAVASHTGKDTVVYLPHHSVVKSSSTTTKVRVVFNASSLSSNLTSLNDHQMIGPKLQLDLSALHTRWRVHRYVYCADIEKMYRQILIDERDRNYQRILWRQSPANAIQEFQLLTVTYGTASAPFLAMRVLKQLAVDEGREFPLAVDIIRDRIFVDDCLFGAFTHIAARESRNQLIALLRRGGFRLRKWASNSPELLSDIDPGDHSLACDRSLQPDDSLRVLGIVWNPSSDTYRFAVQCESLTAVTKRGVLSIIARLYDPLGWLSPIIIVAKVFMQSLWAHGLDWDSSLPDALITQWEEFYRHLPLLNGVIIPRWLGIGPNVIRHELHGFSDASTAAYAAVVYSLVELRSGIIHIRLLASKSKVAPVKQLTIPRLELCGAVLLARLISGISGSNEFKYFTRYCWTDATIVLAWLQAQSSQWQTFIANRVSEIHSLIPDVQWRHVPGTHNPADLASRGMKAADIKTSSLWWQGPTWLLQSPSDWPARTPQVPSDAPLERKIIRLNTVVNPVDCELSTRFSSWPRLLRVSALMLRWSPRWNIKRSVPDSLIVTAEEIKQVTIRWISLMQSRQFVSEIDILQRNEFSPDGYKRLKSLQLLSRSSKLRRLNPVMDSDGLLRVGGRLSLSNLDPSTKFPMILSNSHLARIIVVSAHHRCLHGGISLTLSKLRDTFWVLQARKIIKSIIFHCVVCARIKAEMPLQLMGSLPSARVNRPGRAFEECGVDYAGPVQVRMAGGRGARAHPAYIAVFVCLATKAVHLEIATDYSTAAYLAAFQRFSSRRGLPRVMHSDRGTNFQGADKEMRQAFRAVTTDPELRARLANDQIEWRFIPPAAPHFGGLWEAGVKSMKRHLIRVLGSRTPTYEELATLLCRIEACMNSRPLGPLQDDAESLDVLTPAHFLVGGSLTTVPQVTMLDVATNRLSRWQAIQQMLETFWNRWSEDYVRSCQHRTKWQRRTECLRVGQIVLLRNENLPPTKWELARITRCYPGCDGLIRVVDIKTARSAYTRPITKLALLPVYLEETDNPPVQ